MTILALDTSALSRSVAVIEKGEVKSMVGVTAQRGSPEHILTLVEEALGEAWARVEELEAVAVCRGPGSLTGLRVGIGTARGIAIGIGRPLIGVSSLRAIAAACGAGPQVLALVEAGRGELYGCLFAPGAPARPLGAERVGSPAVFAEAVAGREVRVAGPGASRYRDVMGLNGTIQMASGELLAGSVGLLAASLLANPEDTDASPRYLRREQGPVRFEG